jgi:hypothetical protein
MEAGENKVFLQFKEMLGYHFDDMNPEQIESLAEIASVHSEMEFIEAKHSGKEPYSTLPLSLWVLRGVLKKFPDLKLECNGEDLRRSIMKIGVKEFFMEVFPETVDMDMELQSMLRDTMIDEIGKDIEKVGAKTLVTRRVISDFDINKIECKIILTYNLK